MEVTVRYLQLPLSFLTHSLNLFNTDAFTIWIWNVYVLNYWSQAENTNFWSWWKLSRLAYEKGCIAGGVCFYLVPETCQASPLLLIPVSPAPLVVQMNCNGCWNPRVVPMEAAHDNKYKARSRHIKVMFPRHPSCYRTCLYLKKKKSTDPSNLNKPHTNALVLSVWGPT